MGGGVIFVYIPILAYKNHVDKKICNYPKVNVASTVFKDAVMKGHNVKRRDNNDRIENCSSHTRENPPANCLPLQRLHKVL